LYAIFICLVFQLAKLYISFKKTKKNSEKELILFKISKLFMISMFTESSTQYLIPYCVFLPHLPAPGRQSKG
jgi:tellurite resistance protein TehA-like permease